MNQSNGRSAKAWTIVSMVLVATAVFCGRAGATNDVISQWTFETASPGGTTTTNGPWGAEFGLAGGFPASQATGVHATASTWSSPAGNGSSKCFSVTNWAAGDYWQFQTDSTVSGGLSNIGLQVDQTSSTTGPRDFTLSYSTNGTTFTNFANYSIQPNANPAWSSAGAVAPLGLDTYDFNLSSITALNNFSTIYFRLTAASPLVAAQQGSTPAATGTSRVDNVTVFANFNPAVSATVGGNPDTYGIGVPLIVPQAPASPVLPQAGDIVVGLGSGRQKTTLELVRGTVTLNGGTKPAPYSSWTAQNFSRFVRFDNLNGTGHNVHGNMLALDTGATTAGGGNIYSYATQGSIPSPAPQLLANTGSTSGSAAASTIGGLSVSPDNTKIALMGFNTGKVIVYDYTAGNGLGTGSPALSGLRQSAAILGTGTNYTAGAQQGTAWKDNNTVLAFAGDGKLYTVDATSMANSNVATVTIPTVTGASTVIPQISTAVAYNPAISPYVFAMYSGFSGSTQTPASTNFNKLYIFDPANSYNDLTGGSGIDFSTSANTIRDIALGKNGNLFLVTNSPVSSTNNTGRVEYIPGVTTTLGSTSPNTSVDWFNDDIFQSQPGFTGMDIGFLTADFNVNGTVDSADFVKWRKTNAGGAAGYSDYRANFGNSAPANSPGLGAVPEPASAMLFILGIAAMCLRRRGA
jgi:hypothetical protein